MGVIRRNLFNWLPGFKIHFICNRQCRFSLVDIRNILVPFTQVKYFISRDGEWCKGDHLMVISWSTGSFNCQLLIVKVFLPKVLVTFRLTFFF